MRFRLRSLLLAVPLVVWRPDAPPSPPPAPSIDVERLGDGVWAITRRDGIAFGNNANSLVVVGERDVLVVDAQFTRAATLETLAAIRRLTSKPVRWVVNTHWHDDHVAGNQVYRDSFPDVEFIAQENTRADLASLGRENRRQTVGAEPAYVARLRRLAAQGLGGDSTPTTPMERQALARSGEILDAYVADAPRFREELPTVTFRDRLVLQRGAGPAVEVRWFGRGNTRGDAVVLVPSAHVVATGDLVVPPAPFAFNSYPSEWAAALDSILALHAAAIVPGHGPVMHDDAYVARVDSMLRAVTAEVGTAVATGATLEQVRREVTLPAYRQAIGGDEKWTRVLFTSFFLNPVVGRAYEEAKAPGGRLP